MLGMGITIKTVNFKMSKVSFLSPELKGWTSKYTKNYTGLKSPFCECENSNFKDKYQLVNVHKIISKICVFYIRCLIYHCHKYTNFEKCSKKFLSESEKWHSHLSL